MSFKDLMVSVLKNLAVMFAMNQIEVVESVCAIDSV
jgi:hypothetical protein